VLWVAKSGGDFTTVTAALASIHGNDGLHPYLSRVAPGTYAESAGIDLLDYVDIEGSGENVTTLLCGCSSEGLPLVDGSSALVRASGANLHSEMRRITISNAGGEGTDATGVWIGATSNLVVRAARLRGSVSMLRFVSALASAYDSVFNGNTSGMSGRCVGAVDISLNTYACL